MVSKNVLKFEKFQKHLTDKKYQQYLKNIFKVSDFVYNVTNCLEMSKQVFE